MKVCFIVQRYGLNINGGAELLTRQLAEQINKIEDFEVSVITTKAEDYNTWENVYENDVEDINGITVYRFPVEHPRRIRKFLRLNEMVVYGDSKLQTQENWLVEQGPFSPKLIEFIRKNKKETDVFIFCTYLYYPTVAGIREVAEKSILIPFAHDEPYLRMEIFEKLFSSPAAFVFQTDEEKALIRGIYNNYDIPSCMGGAGVEIPDKIDHEYIKKKYGLGKYIIYAGRIDVGKNCDRLIEDFIRYCDETDSDITLLMIGKKLIDIPEHRNIKCLGFVSDEEKFNAIAGAEFLVLPSKYESLSIVVLEAFSLCKSVLVNGDCPVLKGHCEKSGGGFYYRNYEEFKEYTDKLINEPGLNKSMGEHGKEYVNRRFNWDIIRGKLENMIRYVCDNKADR
ncbi:glycosyltransferase family 4 protein [Butyrivibrio sp. AE3004]|uniref:glycosyltransferase family 4 protein n=1 Tax=Butyrivibrio sp. AE3004 TaxID=1506994 RepID=UPI000493F67E|nr:glycosyltransferase family 4 protein [Butyrivibrio sp. AE3004]